MQIRCALVGMPGSGKYTVGRQLAHRLGVAFVDLDHRLEQVMGTTIRNYFETKGEERFRDLEARVLAEVAQQPGGLVLSTGRRPGRAAPRRQLGRGAGGHGAAFPAAAHLGHRDPGHVVLRRVSVAARPVAGAAAHRSLRLHAGGQRQRGAGAVAHCAVHAGRMDPGPQRRRRWVARASLLMAALFATMAFVQHAGSTVALMILMGLLSGYSILQYADVRSSYPAELTGRGLSLYTMAMFLGVAFMQSATGAVAAWAQGQGLEPYRAVLLAIAAWLALASLAFRWLPVSPLLAPPR